MNNPAIELFDWHRAGDLTLCKPETLRKNAEKDMDQIVREIRKNVLGVSDPGHLITTYYQPYQLEVAGRLAPGTGSVMFTIKLIAIRSHGAVALSE